VRILAAALVLAACSAQSLRAQASLSIASAHTGNFTQGQDSATYTVTVSNAASAGSTSGAVTVTEALSSGLTLVSMAGAGWTCASGGNTCTRSDALAAGASYPVITVAVRVGSSALSPQVNGVTASGGGSATASATDSTTVLVWPGSYVISTYAGNGEWGYSGDNGPATAGELMVPEGLAVDRAGNLYIVDRRAQVIRMVSPAGVITTVAGGGTNLGYNTGDGGPATSGVLDDPVFVALDGAGDLYILDNSGGSVREVSAGIITTAVRLGSAAFVSGYTGFAVDGEGDLYVDSGDGICAVTSSSAGYCLGVVDQNWRAGYWGDGGPAAAAEVFDAEGLSMDGVGNLYIADHDNYRVRMVSAAGVITTVAGNGQCCYAGDGGPASSAEIDPDSVAVDSAGNLYIADVKDNVIRMVAASGIITTIAGNGSQGYLGDGGLASAAELNSPAGLAVDGAGNLYVSDQNNYRIRVLRPSVATGVSIITPSPLPPATLGVSYSQTLSGSGGTAPYAWGAVSLPPGLSLSGAGVLSGVPAAAGSFTFTVGLADSALGTATRTFSLAVGAPSGTPAQLSVVSAHASSFLQGQGGATYTVTVSNAATGGPTSGTVTVTDTLPSGLTPGMMKVGLLLTSMAGTGWLCGGVGDTTCTRSDALAGGLSYPPITLTVNVASNATSPQVNQVSVSGGSSEAASATDSTVILAAPPAFTIFTLAGSGSPGYTGDGGKAIGAKLYNPQGVAVDGSGNVYIADLNNFAVRKVSPAGIITTVAGNGMQGYSGDEGFATAAELSWTSGVAVDGSGNLYIADQYNNAVRKVSPAGIITTVAGNGTQGFSGDAGRATSAELNLPCGVAVDGAGNLYIADQGNNRIRKVSAAGIITTVAGNGTAGYTGDNIAASSAELNNPTAVAVDAAGNVYIADDFNERIREVSTQGVISTVAGTGAKGYSGDGLAATAAQLNGPVGIAVDGLGNLYIADLGNDRIREVSLTGTIATIAGNGTGGYSGDGVPATDAELYWPWGVALDATGDVYIADTNNQRVRLLRPSIATGLSISTPSPLPTATVGVPYSLMLIASGGVAPYTWLQTSGALPGGLTLSSAGPLYGTPTAAGSYTFTLCVSDSAGGILNQAYSLTVGAASTAQLSVTSAHAGSFTQGQAGATYTLTVSNATGAPATSGAVTVTETVPGGLTLVSMAGLGWTCSGAACARSDALAGGATYPAITATVNVASGATSPEVNQVSVSGGGSPTATGADLSIILVSPVTYTISTIAGNGTFGVTGDGGQAADAEIANPQGVALDGAGNLYIAADGAAVREVTPQGVISSLTVMSSGTLAMDAAGNLYIPDSTGNVVRQVSPAGTVTIVAGNGMQGSSGDNGPATSAELWWPSAAAVDAAGNLYILDSGNQVVRKVSGGIITTVAGNGTPGYAGDGGPAIDAEFNEPVGLAVDASGNLYIADYANQRIRMVSLRTGAITTVAGNGSWGYSGDGGPAAEAELYNPQAVAVDAAGNLYIADTGKVKTITSEAGVSERIRKVSPDGNITTVAGNGTEGYAGDGGPATSAELDSPFGLAVSSAGDIYIADRNNQRVRVLRPVLATGLSISTSAALPAAVVGTAYSQALTASAGVPPYSWQVASGALPGGLSLSASGVLSGVPATPGTYDFTAAVADSGFGMASQAFSITVESFAPLLSISSVHSGSFTPGQGAATYSLTVGNWVAAGPTVGAVTVTETVPSGLTLVAMAGTGWTCAALGNTCTRSDALAPGASYPPITVVVNVASNAASPQVNQVSVSGGGTSGTVSATDSTTITQSGPAPTALSISTASPLAPATVGVTYSQTLAASGGTPPYTWSVASGALPGGLSLSTSGVLSGTPSATGTFTFTASVADSASGTATESLTLTVSPAASAGAPQLSIVSSHTGSFAQGQNGDTYTVTVSNAASAGATSGTVTVTESLPSGLTLISMAGTGWYCDFGVCTLGDTLAAGASYPPITVTVNVASNAASPQLNQVSVSGGGSATASATDSTAILTSQAITFAALGNVVLSVSPFSLSATASSGLAVSFSASPASVCTVSGNSVTILAVGTCSITASQAGNASYAAAAPVTQMFSVTSTCSITGQTTESGSVLRGASVTLSGSSSATTTVDDSGDYSFTGLAPGGNYTVMASLTGYAFTPQSVAFNNLSSNQTGDFAATAADGSVFPASLPTGCSVAANMKAAPTALTAPASFSVPINITLLPAESVSALTFGVQVTPNGAAPALTGPLSFTGSSAIVDVPNTNAGGTSNSLGVVWPSFTNALSGGTQPLGTLSGSIPAGAQVGQGYTVAITGVSATSGGSAQTPVPVSIGANGAITVAFTYLEGDLAPYNSDTTPNFGDGVLDIRDLIQELFAVNSIPGFKPSKCSDRFDAMDLYPADTATTRGGDGLLDIRDLILELFRVNNLDASRPVRASQGGACASGSSSAGNAAEASPMDAASRPQRAPDGALILGAAESTGAGTARVPVYLTASRNLTNIALTFAAGDLQSQLHFVSVPAAAPALVQDSQTGAVAVVWQSGISVPAGQRLLLGYVAGPSDALANIRIFGSSAAGADDNREIKLEGPAPSRQ
jgi:uncharacterized repeat protein (TIGR01451 family)